jgi:hypothetical protein
MEAPTLTQESESRDYNPWIDMWFRPRETVRYLLDYRVKRWIYVLVCLNGISHVLDRASNKSMGDDMSLSMILLFSLLIGPIAGIIGWIIFSGVIRLAGKILKLEADGREVRAAVAWSYVPIAWSLILWIPALLIFKDELFLSQTPVIDSSPLLMSLLLLFSLLDFILFIWHAVILSKSVGEVFGCSAWKGLGTVVLGFMILTVPFVLILLPFILLS